VRRETHRSTRRQTLAAVGATLAGLGGCVSRSGRRETAAQTTTGHSSNLSGTVRIAGSSTVYPLTLAIGNAFTAVHPDVDVAATSTGTGGGFAEFFCSGRTDINDASRPIASDEREACRAAGVEPIPFHVATDALTVVTSTDAEWAGCVTLAELADVWRRGGAARWSDVTPTWPDEPVELYGPTPASGTFDFFSETVLGADEEHRTDYSGTEEDSTIVGQVRASPYAMGYFGYAYYAQNSEAVRALSIRADATCVKPSLSNAQSGVYGALSRPLFIYVSREALERDVVRAFVRFYLEQVTGEIVRDVGYAPVSEETGLENLARLERAISQVV
jgi:phosphate transport system substrate-binding protein